jgi:hypothetical protein
MPPANPSSESRAVSGDEIAGLLRPFIGAPDRLPTGAVMVGEPLPGLIATITVHMGDQVNFLPEASVTELGGQAAVWAVAVANLRRLPPIRAAGAAEAAAGHADSLVHELRSDDPFGAARICRLDDVLSAAGVTPGPRGLLLAVPTWYAVLLHPLTGPGVLPALKLMANAASQEYESASGPQGVSPDVFFLTADGEVQTVAYADGMNGLVLNTDGLLGGQLFGPQGLLGQSN